MHQNYYDMHVFYNLHYVGQSKGLLRLMRDRGSYGEH
jgi:hypothetical protein